MGERPQAFRSQAMATTSTAVATVTQPLQEEPVERVAVITLRQTAPATKTECRRKVVWTEDTVDNEHMDKKKSKCCCIYHKPRKFGESDSESSDDDEDCEHCLKHVEKKRIKIQTKPSSQTTQTEVNTESAQEPTALLELKPPPAPAPAPDPAPAPAQPH